MHILNGGPLTPGQPFTVGEVQYPANVLTLWSAEDLAAIGVTWQAPPAPSLDQAKAARVEAVAEARKAAVINGFSFNGLPLKLDESTENALGKAHTSLSRQPEGTAIDWEVMRGVFMPFDLPTVAAISDAAFAHVQACFTNAKRLTLLIHDAADLEALDAIELDGWPA